MLKGLLETLTIKGIRFKESLRYNIIIMLKTKFLKQKIDDNYTVHMFNNSSLYDISNVNSRLILGCDFGVVKKQK